MRTQITIFGVNHYDMTDEKQKRQFGARIQFLGDLNITNNHFGLAVPNAEIPYEELKDLATVKFPAVFEADLLMGVAKKKGSGIEVPVVNFANLVFKHCVELVPVK